MAKKIENGGCGNEIRVGTILEGDFGCTMTLPAFYQVVRVTASGKSAEVRRIETRNVSHDGGWTGSCVPEPGRFREQEGSLKRIRRMHWGDGIREGVFIRGKYFAVWDGEPAYFDHWD